MIAFKIGDEYLDLAPNTSLSIEINNPLFNFEQTAGTITYPISIPLTKKNQRLLGFPERLANVSSAPVTLPAECYIEHVLWRIGRLRYRGYTGQAYSLNFQTDAGDFQSLTKDRKLSGLDLGSAAFSATVKSLDDLYALFPIHNPEFWDGKNPTFNGHVNYYDGAFSGDTFTPFPYLTYVLQKVIETYGYQLAGAWLAEEETRRICIYNTRAMDGASNFQIKNHLPELNVGEFLQAIRIQFALAYIFQANSKTLQIIRLNDIIDNPAYIDWSKKADKMYSDEAIDRNGFTLEQTPDNADELQNDAKWLSYSVLGGREKITTAAGTLLWDLQADTAKPARSWYIPKARQKGNSSQHELGTTNNYSLRLLSYRSLATDNQGNTYPQGSNYPLRLANIYPYIWEKWLSFENNARPVERSIRLNIADLLTLDPTRKIYIAAPEGTTLNFWEKISISASLKGGLSAARVSFLKV